jgi:hypothetical protein
MHIKRIPQQMRLMAPPLPQALKLRLLKVIHQYGLIIRMRTLVDNHAGALPRRQASNVCEPLLGNDDIQVVFRLVNVRAHGHDATHAGRIRLGRTRRRRVHDAVLGGAQEIGRPAEAVEHARAHYAGGVCVGVDVDFNGRVHANHAETTDDFGRVGDLLGAEEELGSVVVPLFVEALEAVGGEADGCCGGEVEVARVEEVEETVLQDFGPYAEVFEVGAAGLGTFVSSEGRKRG